MLTKAQLDSHRGFDTVQNNSLELILKAKSLFYQCHFNQVIQFIEQQSQLTKLPIELLMIKAKSYYELHEMDKFKALFKTIETQELSANATNFYFIGSVEYVECNYPRALQAFESSLSLATDPQSKFKAFLGVLNTYYSMKKFHLMPNIMSKAVELLSKVDKELQLSFIILNGNYHYASGSNIELGKEYFQDALTESINSDLKFFVIRSLYGLSCIDQALNQPQALAARLEVLNCFLQNSQTKFISFLVNEKFKDDNFTVKQDIKLDQKSRSVTINNDTHCFDNKPLIFKLLQLLFTKRTFVSKAELADELWATEVYKPRMHDPRIFDIIKRTRKMIEQYDKKPLVIISGKLGYKLAIN